MTIHKNLMLNKRHQFAILYRIMRKCATQKKPHHDQTHSRSEWRIAHCCTCNDATGAKTQHKRGTLAVAFQCESFLYSRFSSHEWMMQKECISRPQPATPFDIVVDISQNWHLFSSLNWTESNSLNNFCIFLNCPYDWCVCVCVQVALPLFFYHFSRSSRLSFSSSSSPITFSTVPVYACMCAHSSSASFCWQSVCHFSSIPAFLFLSYLFFAICIWYWTVDISILMPRLNEAQNKWNRAYSPYNLVDFLHSNMNHFSPIHSRAFHQ